MGGTRQSTLSGLITDLLSRVPKLPLVPVHVDAEPLVDVMRKLSGRMSPAALQVAESVKALAVTTQVSRYCSSSFN